MWIDFSTPQNWLNTLDPAKDPSPQKLIPFLNLCLKGSYFVLILDALASITSVVVEILAAALLGLSLTWFWRLAQKEAH